MHFARQTWLVLNGSSEISKTSQSPVHLGHIETVFRALAQFPQWRSFCENALSVDLDFPSVATVDESAKALAREVAKSGAVDPSVADALETVSQWATDKPNPDKRDVLSLVRTLENVGRRSQNHSYPSGRRWYHKLEKRLPSPSLAH